MKKMVDVAGNVVYIGLAGVVVSIFTILLGTILWSLIFGA